MAKSWVSKNWFKVSILVVLIAFLLLGFWIFNSGVLAGFNTSIFNTISSSDAEDFEELTPSFECSFDFNDNDVCVGDLVTATIKADPNSDCRIAFKTNVDNWTDGRIYGDITLDNFGEGVTTDNPMISGEYIFASVCANTEGELCRTNDEFINVGLCDDATFPEDPDFTCTDGDGGIFFETLSHCEDSYHSLGFSDECNGNNAIEYYCDNINVCRFETKVCNFPTICVGGDCVEPRCETIVNPTSQLSCDVGSCSHTQGDCIFIQATLVNPAVCTCAD